MPSTTNRPRLSAVIIAKNEARDLPDCLASLAFCDEIILVDSGSTDGTIELAERAGCRVILRPDWAGFGPQKQRALDAASGDWVLSIDADETIPPELAQEIRRAIDGGSAFAGYNVQRITTFLGKPLRYGGWHTGPTLRLARRSAARFTADLVHEKLLVEGTIGDLVHPMPHHSYRDIDEILDKQRHYALSGAAQRRERGRSGGLAKAITRATLAFGRHYVSKRGFLDGKHGLVAAVSVSQEIFWRYLAAGWER